MRKMLVIGVAGLGERELAAVALPECVARGALMPPFPALTCVSQATFRTGRPPSAHGMVCNGYFDRTLRKSFFWEQSAALVEGPRLWDGLRSSGRRVGMMFWQQSLGESVDIVLSPAPIHKHHGGMALDCYSRPASLYARLRADFGEFPLRHYWGPMADADVGNWIVQATASVMAREAPDVLFTYLPTLDYDFQRFGPDDPRSALALDKLKAQLAGLLESAGYAGYDWLFCGDYAIEPCRTRDAVVYPNRLLREAGFLCVRDVRGRSYVELRETAAFALVDHAVAHVFVTDPALCDAVAALFATDARIAACLTGERRAARGLAHPRCAEIVLEAAQGCWFAYPWWERSDSEPDYARHVDIHNKPGFDPCELFMQWAPPGIDATPERVGGTHGRGGAPVGWAAGFDPGAAPTSLAELSAALQRLLERPPTHRGR